MSYILHIDTATENAYVTLAENGIPLQTVFNSTQQDHAAFLQPAIKEMMGKLSISLNELDAIAVNEGPGSYTGLRVGLASAKGLCYALGKPLITISGLYLMAKALKPGITDQFICPMIDARRMEVFTSVFNNEMQEIIPATAIVLTQDTFKEIIKNKPVIICGNGAKKFMQITTLAQIEYRQLPALQPAISEIANVYFISKRFTDLAYSEPLYLKAFYDNR